MHLRRELQDRCPRAGVKGLVTEESNSRHNGKNIYREVAKYAKDVKNKDGFVLIQDLQDFLRDFRGFPKWPPFFHRPWRFQGFCSGLSRLGEANERHSVPELRMHGCFFDNRSS